MLNKIENIQSEIILYTLEDLVPKESLFRKIDKYIDFTFIYDEVKDLYCSNNGRNSVDPVVLFKLVFIQTIDGLKSMRRTCEKAKVDLEYRWFLGIPLGKNTPHYSTFSQNYIRRFKDTDIFEKIFVNIVEQAIVNEVKKRKKWLEEEINNERKNQNKKEFDFEDEIERKEIKVSNTDTESGYYHRDNKEKGFMYLDHRTVDSKCNIIVDCYITKGNVHDSIPYISRLEYIKNKFGFNIKEVGIDSGYNTIDIKKYLHDNNIFGVIAYRRYAKAETTVKKNRFNYLKECDCYVCPETGAILEYTGRIDRNGYKYYSSKENCKGCPLTNGCCNKKEYRIITRHICEELNEEMRERRLSERGKVLYKQRKEHVERSFADSKNNHAYRYAMYRGIEKNQNYTWLICAAQNMKNIAIKKEKVWA